MISKKNLIKTILSISLLLATPTVFAGCKNVSLETDNTKTTSESISYSNKENDLYTAHEWEEAECSNLVLVTDGACKEYNVNPGEVIYTGLDNLGRPGRVSACVTYSMYENGSERERDNLPNPAGWPKTNTKVKITWADGTEYNGYAFNRSHLLAKSLGGEDKLENLVTGTRAQNVGKNDGKGGMAYTETLARDWLKKHQDGTIDYIVTPVYKDDNLLPSSVYVDMHTSDDEYDLHVEVFNAMPGYSIDYSGTSETLIKTQ